MATLTTTFIFLFWLIFVKISQVFKNFSKIWVSSCKVFVTVFAFNYLLVYCLDFFNCPSSFEPIFSCSITKIIQFAGRFSNILIVIEFKLVVQIWRLEKIIILDKTKDKISWVSAVHGCHEALWISYQIIKFANHTET